MVERERTLFSDRAGEEIFLGDVVRTQIEEAFQHTHGAWAEYEVTKAAGGYVLSYVRSEKGCVLPFGYTATFINQYALDELPDLKMLLWSKEIVRHPALEVVEDGMTGDTRRELFMIELKARRALEKRRS